jgi:predicted nucleotidyltransferase
MAASSRAGKTGQENAEPMGSGVMTSSVALPPLGPDQVLPLMRERQGAWRQRYQLQRIGLFGSTARNEATATSDVDAWVELDPLTPYATVHLKQELEELLQRPVDLVRVAGTHEPRPASGHPAGGHQRMSGDRLLCSPSPASGTAGQ